MKQPDINIALELYLGHEPDFLNEVELRKTDDGIQISVWNAEKNKPTISELETLFSNSGEALIDQKYKAKQKAAMIIAESNKLAEQSLISKGELDSNGDVI